MSNKHLVIKSVQTGEPEAPLISVKAMKSFLNLSTDTTDDDDLLGGLIAAATREAENRTWRSLAKKTYTQYMSGFPRFHFHEHYISPLSHRVYNRHQTSDPQAIKLWFPPLISVQSVIYIQLDGTEVTLTPEQDFQVDLAAEPGEITPLPGQIWPYTLAHVRNSVRINYTAGYEVKSAARQDEDSGSVTEPETEATGSNPPTPPAEVTSYTIERTIPATLILAVKQLVAHWYSNREPVVAGSISELPSHVERLLDTERCWDFSITP